MGPTTYTLNTEDNWAVLMAVGTDWQRHEDQECSFPRARCKCNDPGICVFLYLCFILALIQDQALVASKHYLIETKEKPPVDSAVDHGSINLLPEKLKEKDDEGNDEEDSSEDGNDYFWHWGSRWGSQCPQGMHFS